MRRLMCVLLTAFVLTACVPPADLVHVHAEDVRAFWSNPATTNMLGVHFCYGDNKSVISTNPRIAEIDYFGTILHELIHEEQCKRLGAVKLREYYNTPEGQTLLEGEAYYRAGKMRGQELVYQLLYYYPKVQQLRADSVAGLLRAHGFYE